MGSKNNSFVLSRAVYSGLGTFDAVKAHLIKGELDKHPLLTTTYLCGQYAYYAATAMDSINRRTFRAELKLLNDIGVVFDFDAALRHAEHFKRMLDNDSAELIWY